MTFGTQGIGRQRDHFQDHMRMRGLQDQNNRTGQNDPTQQMLDLLQKINDKLNQQPQASGGCNGGGSPQAAQGSQGAQNGATDNADDLDKLFRKLQQLAAQNPQALAAALKQNPQLMGVVQAALSGGAGGGSIGGVGHA